MNSTSDSVAGDPTFLGGTAEAGAAQALRERDLARLTAAAVRGVRQHAIVAGVAREENRGSGTDLIAGASRSPSLNEEPLTFNALPARAADAL